eukprot:1539649-Prymnesium_polylepis.1
MRPAVSGRLIECARRGLHWTFPEGRREQDGEQTLECLSFLCVCRVNKFVSAVCATAPMVKVVGIRPWSVLKNSVLHYRQMSYSLRHLTITTKIRSTVVGGETVPMEEPVEPPFKKQRFSEGKYALLSCFDEPDNFIEVNVSLIDSIGCRLASLIKHTAPSVAPSGKIFWRSDMTRAMLL